MKVLHIVAGDLIGGASRGAYWLHRALIELGIDSKIFTNSKLTFGDERVYSVLKTKKDKFLNIIRSQLDENLQILYPKRIRAIFSTGLFGIDFTKTELYREADIVHLHWINAGFVNIKHLSKVNKPILWTIRDMWPMTGGCHYTMGCENFKNGCGKCKQLNSKFKYDLSWFILRRKKKYLPKHIKIIAISPWLAEEAKKSEIFKDFDVRYIFNNIDTSEFFPIDKKLAREILGIRTNKKIILVGASNLTDFYKGFEKFLDAIKFLDKNKYFLCFFGYLNEKLVKDLGFDYKIFGFLYDNISLRLLYSASDVFVAPSLMEAFGKTIAEAMACGTPVVCFDATGPKYIVDHKINGYKAIPFEPFDLAQGIEWISNLSEREYTKLSQNAREKVVREFDSKIVAKKYIKLYEEILNRK